MPAAVPLNRPSVWSALLWRDWRQVAPSLMALVVSVVALQALLLLIYSLMSAPQHEGLALQSTLMLTLIAPILGALACSGMLIGQERQSGTWAWSSSLPVSWSRVLASKLVVTTAVSLLIVLPLAVIPLAAFALGYRLPQRESLSAIYATPIVALLAIDVVVFFFLSVLLFRETLTGMIVGAVCVTGLQLFLAAWTTPLIYRWLAYSGLMGTTDMWILALQMVILQLLGLVAMTLVFRWRWGTGQQAVWLPRLWSTSGTTPLTIERRSYRQPREFFALLRQSWRVSLVARLWTIVALLGIIGYAAGSATSEGLFPMAAMAAACLIGVTAFEGDQSLGRFRFLADRGVGTRRLILARLIPPAIIALGLFGGSLSTWAVTSSARLWGADFWIVLAAFFAAMFAASALASLCFPKPVIAWLIAIVLTISIPLVYAAVLQSAVQWLDPNPRWLGLYTVWLLPLTIVVLVVAIFVLANRWLIRERPLLSRHFAWVVTVAFGLPLLLPAGFGFLAVPNRPWLGVPLEQATKLPGPVPQLPSRALIPSSVAYTVPDLRIGNYAANDQEWDFPQLLSQLLSLQQPSRMADSVDALLSDLEEGGVGVDDVQPMEYVRNLDTLIRESAILGALYVAQRKYDSARRAWKANRALQEIELGPYIVFTLRGRAVSCAAWLELSPREIAQLAPEEELEKEYLPPTDISQEFAQYLRAQATLYREHLRTGEDVSGGMPTYGEWSPLTYMIPTLRWRAERVLAMRLEQNLAYPAASDLSTLEYRTWLTWRSQLQQHIASIPEFSPQPRAEEK